ncbi:MAG: hypothetical protein O7H41_20190 [Planctomycetota bacterium]|nr:hypothetical protein [Planctomycetota bacterium]
MSRASISKVLIPGLILCALVFLLGKDMAKSRTIADLEADLDTLETRVLTHRAEVSMLKEVTDLLQARGIAIVDEMGRTRILLSAVENNTSLSLYDEHGKTRAVLAETPAGSTLSLLDNFQRPSLELQVGPEGSPRVLLKDETGRNRIILGLRDLKEAAIGVTRSTPPALAMYDAEGRARGIFKMIESGQVKLIIVGQDGARRATLMESDSGRGVHLVLKSGDSAATADLSVHGDGKAQLLFTDAKENRRVELLQHADGLARLRVQDANGRIEGILGAGEEGAVIGLNDDQARPRVRMRYQTETDSVRISITGKDGKTLWDAP